MGRWFSYERERERERERGRKGGRRQRKRALCIDNVVDIVMCESSSVYLYFKVYIFSDWKSTVK